MGFKDKEKNCVQRNYPFSVPFPDCIIEISQDKTMTKLCPMIVINVVLKRFILGTFLLLGSSFNHQTWMFFLLMTGTFKWKEKKLKTWKWLWHVYFTYFWISLKKHVQWQVLDQGYYNIIHCSGVETGEKGGVLTSCLENVKFQKRWSSV